MYGDYRGPRALSPPLRQKIMPNIMDGRKGLVAYKFVERPDLKHAMRVIGEHSAGLRD